MARIYLSSTFEDLKEHREKAYDALRQLGHDVVAMEDYVARDARPLDACLGDIDKSDVYVLFVAWRYGYIPEDGNPDRCSITELEYRHAVVKPRLVFLLDEGVAWLPRFIDDGEKKRQVHALRFSGGSDC